MSLLGIIDRMIFDFGPAGTAIKAVVDKGD